MDAKITRTNENAVLGRKEISASVSFDKGTPLRKEIKEALCSKIGANPETAVLAEVASKFGTREVDVLMHVYPTKEAALGTEPRHVLVRDGMAEKKPKKEKKAAPPQKK